VLTDPKRIQKEAKILDHHGEIIVGGLFGVSQRITPCRIIGQRGKQQIASLNQSDFARLFLTIFSACLHHIIAAQ
jgi:hypothetical protein